MPLRLAACSLLHVRHTKNDTQTARSYEDTNAFRYQSSHSQMHRARAVRVLSLPSLAHTLGPSYTGPHCCATNATATRGCVQKKFRPMHGLWLYARSRGPS